MDSYENKNIWIIGASSGIGLALAKNLHKQEANLILSARNEANLKQLNDKLENKHKVAPLDVTNFDKLKTTASKLGQIDSVIFMAGIYEPKPIDQVTINNVQRTIDVNIQGAFNCVLAALPVLKKQNSGQLVLCGSIAGYRGLDSAQPYCATKAAVISLAESLRLELKNTNVDVKMISPGFVKTRLTDKNTFKMPFIISSEKAADYIAKGLLTKRFEIHFPKRMTYLFKILRILPFWLYKRIV